MEYESPTPPLSLHDAEKVVRRLGPALQQHGAWIRRIYSMLACRTMPHPDDLESDAHLRTDFGRWLSEETNEYVCEQPEYREAFEYHRKAHEIARRFCEAVRGGETISPQQFEEFAATVDLLDTSIDVLVKELWDLVRYTDPLTGIPTRYAMLPRLKQERDRAHRTGHPCSICMVDLDLFKEINDVYGHAAGDKVLEGVSAYFVRNLRQYDQVCRFGGEEFVLMLPDTSPDAAEPVVDRLRRGLAQMTFELQQGRSVQITASFGIAPLATDRSVRDSIGNADQAMYEAKHAGRNRVYVWKQ